MVDVGYMDTYRIGDHRGKDWALAIVAIVLAGDE